MSYYILQEDETKGPYTIGQLRSMWNSGALTGDTLYCEEGYEEWLHLRVLADQLEPPPAASAPPVSPAPMRPSHLHPPARGTRGIGIAGCLVVLGVFILLAILVSIGGSGTGGGSASQEPYPTDAGNLQRLEEVVAGYQAAGVFTKIEVYSGDQAWVYVSDRFSRLAIDDKRNAIAAVYSVYHHNNNVDFVGLYDAYTGKGCGRYHPSFGLKLE